MKRIRLLVVFVALLMIVSLAAGCGSDINLSASMSDLNEPEEASVVADEKEESADIEEFDYEYADDEGDGQTEIIEEKQVVDDKTITVVLNTNKDRKRIHIPDTSCAKQIHKENYLEWTGTESELVEFAIKNGYVACGRCHPDTKLGIDLTKKD